LECGGPSRRFGIARLMPRAGVGSAPTLGCEVGVRRIMPLGPCPGLKPPG